MRRRHRGAGCLCLTDRLYQVGNSVFIVGYLTIAAVGGSIVIEGVGMIGSLMAVGEGKRGFIDAAIVVAIVVGVWG